MAVHKFSGMHVSSLLQYIPELDKRIKPQKSSIYLADQFPNAFPTKLRNLAEFLMIASTKKYGEKSRNKHGTRLRDG
jgi:hypothetical protein